MWEMQTEPVGLGLYMCHANCNANSTLALARSHVRELKESVFQNRILLTAILRG